MKKCTNAEHPDVYGHYRQAKYTQTKHHWIWKLKFVFEKIKLLENYHGQVLLLEDDFYLSPDILYTIQQLLEVKQLKCQDCRVFVMGNEYLYSKQTDIKRLLPRVMNVVQLKSDLFYVMGLVFDKDFWLEIRRCADKFCTYDDYNWDWTLKFLDRKCFANKKTKVLRMLGVRLLHLGICGMHDHKIRDCKHNLEQLKGLYKQYAKSLFPRKLNLTGKGKRFPSRQNGGWGDKRDHEMCLSMLGDEQYLQNMYRNS